MERKRCCSLLSVCKITTFSALLQVKPQGNKRNPTIFSDFFSYHPYLPSQYVRQGLSALLSTFYRSDNAWQNFVFSAFHSVTAILRDSPRNGVTERGKTIRNRVQGNMKKQLFLGKYRILLFTLSKTCTNSPP